MLTRASAPVWWLLIERVPGRSGWHEVIHPERWRSRGEAVREAQWLAAATNHAVVVRRLDGISDHEPAVEVRPA